MHTFGIDNVQNLGFSAQVCISGFEQKGSATQIAVLKYSHPKPREGLTEVFKSRQLRFAEDVRGRCSISLQLERSQSKLGFEHVETTQAF